MTPVIFKKPERRRYRPAIRVMLLMDDPARRSACSGIIGEGGGVVIMGSPDEDDLARICRQIRPDVVALGQSGSELAADELIKKVMGIKRGSRLLVIGESTSASRVRAVQGLGALGYLSWQSLSIALLHGIRTVARGRCFAGPDIIRTAPVRNDISVTESLTEEELDVLRHLASGLPLRRVAMALGLPTTTVGRCQTRLRKKLGAETTIQAVQEAVRLGYLAPGLLPMILAEGAGLQDEPTAGGAGAYGRNSGASGVSAKPGCSRSAANEHQ